MKTLAEYRHALSLNEGNVYRGEFDKVAALMPGHIIKNATWSYRPYNIDVVGISLHTIIQYANIAMEYIITLDYMSGLLKFHIDFKVSEGVSFMKTSGLKVPDYKATDAETSFAMLAKEKKTELTKFFKESVKDALEYFIKEYSKELNDEISGIMGI